MLRLLPLLLLAACASAPVEPPLPELPTIYFACTEPDGELWALMRFESGRLARGLAGFCQDGVGIIGERPAKVYH